MTSFSIENFKNDDWGRISHLVKVMALIVTLRSSWGSKIFFFPEGKKMNFINWKSYDIYNQDKKKNLT